MDNALTPREIQTRIRSGASVDDVVSESGMQAEHVEAFAGPVLAEREHIAGAAQVATVRRRGEAGSHRRLGELISNRLRSRGIDADSLTWDAWRQPDLKWRVVARLVGDVEGREAEFVFDAKARFSVAANADARWMIGEEMPGARPEEENTVDLDDELALVRAVTTRPAPESPGDDVPASDLMHEGNEDTSQLDRLYDMLSGISEDSVRIYTGILDPVLYDEDPEEADEPAPDEEEEVEEPPAVHHRRHAHPPRWEEEADEPTREVVLEEIEVEAVAVEEPAEEEPAAAPELEPDPAGPDQDALIDADEPTTRVTKPRKRRAKVPSWDEIMFGGPKQ